MDLSQKVSREVAAGVLFGAMCLTGILYVLDRTEETAISLSFGSYPGIERGVE